MYRGVKNMLVVNKDSNSKNTYGYEKIYEVYDITYDKNGYPHFLIYKDGQWVRLSAKHFRPIVRTVGSIC